MESYEEILSKMTEKYRELTGFYPDNASDVGIRMKTLAYQIHSLQYSMDQLEQQLFPQTAKGEYLDKHAAQRGLVRKQGTRAMGKVTFTRNSLSEGEGLIPSGTMVSTGGEHPVMYRTKTDLVLAVGEKEVEGEIEAVLPGRQGNAAPLAVKLLVTPISGIGQVSNAKQISGGTEEETDEELRRRLLESYRNISNGSNGAYYLQEALACPGIGFAGVIPRSRGRGTVDVIVYGSKGEPSSQLLQQLRSQLEAKREVNVDIQVKPAQVRQVDITVEVACQQGYSFRNLSVLCQEKIEAYLDSLTVRQPLYQSGLTSLLMSLEGVANCKVSVTGGDVHPLKEQIIRKGTLTVTQMAVAGG